MVKRTIMNNRRRLMMNKLESSAQMVYDGLLCWFDGLDSNLTINSWPCTYGTEENVQYRSLLPRSRYDTTGAVTKLSNGLRLTATGSTRAVLYTYLRSSTTTRKENPLYNTTDITIIVVASNLLVSKATSDFYFTGISNASGTTDNPNRTALMGVNKTNINSLFNWCKNGDTSATWNFTFQENMKGVFATRASMSQNKQDFTAIANNSKFIGGFKTGCKYNNTANDRIILGGYNYIGTYFGNDDNRPGGVNFKIFPGDYHAFLIYNRMLTDNELTLTLNFLKNRYNV